MDASRHLTFTEGTSNKFWKIELDGSSHTVTFGRVGTSGQTQTKDFSDAASARKSYDKLVAEKVKKGYVDAEGSAPASTPAPTATATTSNAATTKKPAAKKAEKPTPAEPTPEPTPTPVPPVPSAPVVAKPVLSATREIALAAEDWLLAGYRQRATQQRGSAKPFDKDECVRRLSKLRTTSYGWDVRWEDLSLPTALSREEAHFWLLAMSKNRGRDAPMDQLAKQCAAEKITGEVDLAQARKLLAKQERTVPELIVLVLSQLLTPTEVFELALDPPTHGTQAWHVSETLRVMLNGVGRYFTPYLTDAEKETLRHHLRQKWDPTKHPASSYAAFPPEYYLAAALGMYDEVLEVVSRIPNDHYQIVEEWASRYQRPQLLLFGLKSADIIEREWRRVKLKVGTPEFARGLLACTEYACLDCFADDVIAASNKEQCAELLEVLTLVRAPEAAVPMLRCQMSAKSPAAAREWLSQHTGHAVAGLLETAATGRGSLAEAALDFLRDVKRRGHTEVLAQAVKACGSPEVAAKIQAEVLDYEEKVYTPIDASNTPAWLTQALKETGTVKAKKLPGWATPTLLPPIIVGNGRLTDEQTTTVLQLLFSTPVGTAQPLLSALRQHVDRHARDTFAWKLVQNWQSDGYPSAGKWALGAVGHIGDDGCVMKLTPMVRVWPGESQHARAVFGLECLRAVGTSVALMQLSGIAQKLKFKGLKTKAEQFVEEIAKDRGLTRAELEDRVVPDCGLDENGRREFSFGPRSFSFVLGGDLKAMVRDADGKLRGDLPKPNAKDDEAQANAAVAEWKLIKTQIKQVATIQADRLEQAMVAGRRWSPTDFETLLVRHPLMTHLVQKLIWATYDASGKRTACFRVTEERDYADVEENAFDLAGVHQVGVVHPLEMTEAERGGWGQVLGDYEIITPFPQLGRKVYALEGNEATQTDLTRCKGVQVVAPTLVGMLEKLGWVRGLAMDGGCFDEHSKQFPAGNVTAVVRYEGTVGMGYIDPNEVLTLDTAYFCAGMRGPGGFEDDTKKKVKLGTISPMVISEVLSHMNALKSKGK